MLSQRGCGIRFIYGREILIGSPGRTFGIGSNAFRWDFTQGTIAINELASPENQRRAEITIRLYRLNVGHPVLRKLEMRRREQGQNDPLGEFAYRHYIDYPSTG
jgi:hypothetical protein